MQKLERQEEKKDEAIGKTEEIVAGMAIPETAMPAIKFHFLNFFRANPVASLDDIEREKTKMAELARKEKLYAEHPKVPTIGTELEIPDGWITQDTSDELNLIGVHNEREPIRNDRWEMNQTWSWSYAVQARAIEEMRKAGILKEPEKDDPLSLHINFGIPKFMDNQFTLYDEPEALNFINASAVAYASPERLLKRHQLPAFVVKADAEKNDRTDYFRLEVRPHEFKDKNAYDMLFELQMASAGLFAFLKEKSAPNDADAVDIELSKIWKELMDKCHGVFDEYGVKRTEMIDTNYADEIGAMNAHPEFKKKVRALFKYYAKQMGNIIFS